jgi:O-antigen ligase
MQSDRQGARRRDGPLYDPRFRMTPLSLAAWCAALFLAANLYAHTVALRLLLLAAGCACAAIALASERRSGRPVRLRALPWLLLPFALWGGWAALSIGWSIEPARSLKEFKNEVVYTALVFWLCYVAAQARGAPRVFLSAVSIGAVGVCAAGIYQFWIPTHEVRALGLWVGPGDQSSALLTLMPGAMTGSWLAARLGMPRALRVAPLGLAALFALSAFSTLNRTVWIGFSVQLVFIGALLVQRPGRRLGARAKLAVGLAAVAIVAGGVAVMVAVQQERFGPHVEATFAKDPRFVLWGTAIDMIEERPWTGSGFGRGIERHSLREELPKLSHEYPLWHAHNLLLEVGVELGIPGMALLLLLIGATAWQGWRLAREHDPVAAACGAAVLGVLAGMLVRNMTDVLWVRQNSLLYWGVVGALLAWGQGRRAPAS